MVTVRFYGSLRQYGDRFPLDVTNAAEAVRALTVQIPGLRQALESGMFRVRWGKKDLKQESLETDLFEQAVEGSVLHIVPVTSGASKSPVVNIIVGVALIGVSWWMGGAAGWGYLGAKGFVGATLMFQIGASLLFTGLSGALSRPPELKADTEDKNTSSSFSSLQNSYAVGKPVPLAYGTVMAGSHIISQGLETVRSAPESGPPLHNPQGYRVEKTLITPQKVDPKFNTAVNSPTVKNRNYILTIHKV